MPARRRAHHSWGRSVVRIVGFQPPRRLVLGLLLAIPALRVLIYCGTSWKTRRRHAAGHCPHCDYDLRATVTDNVGNTRTSALQRILIDNTPPTISGDADTTWHNTDDTVTFTGFGIWSKDNNPHLATVQISVAPDAPFVAIQIDGNLSNVDLKPATIPVP